LRGNGTKQNSRFHPELLVRRFDQNIRQDMTSSIWIQKTIIGPLAESSAPINLNLVLTALANDIAGDDLQIRGKVNLLQ
jgi:hypothetical protein